MSLVHAALPPLPNARRTLNNMVDQKNFALVVSLWTFMFAVIFILCWGFVFGYSLQNVVVLGSAGALIGAIGAPEIYPRLFRFPRLWQMTLAVLGCVLVADNIGVGTLGYIVAIASGLALGYFARFWSLRV